MDLFEASRPHQSPLAHRMRPQTLDAFVGHPLLVGTHGFLSQIAQTNFIPSVIFWGPPGVGKTTIAHLCAQQTESNFITLSAVTAGLKDIKDVVLQAREQLSLYGKRTILFIDEIHRFNKSQQASLLPHIEDGTILFMGATTENPSFEVIGPLLSRCQVLQLSTLTADDLRSIATRALTNVPQGLGHLHLSITEKAMDMLIRSSMGDARQLLNTLETAAHLAKSDSKDQEIQEKHITQAIQKKLISHDKKGENHYNLISAFIKSLRGSDPDAALYYMARLLEAGEDALFIIRRMVIFASEDIGNADPQALNLAINTKDAFHFLGLAEGWIPMAQCATYLACAPKSNASYVAYKKAKQEVQTSGNLKVPLHLCNAPTQLMNEMGYSKGYEYAHNSKDHLSSQQHLPQEIKDSSYYKLDGIGYEKNLLEWVNKAKQKRKTNS